MWEFQGCMCVICNMCQIGDCEIGMDWIARDMQTRTASAPHVVAASWRHVKINVKKSESEKWQIKFYRKCDVWCDIWLRGGTPGSIFGSGRALGEWGVISIGGTTRYIIVNMTRYGQSILDNKQKVFLKWFSTSNISFGTDYFMKLYMRPFVSISKWGIWLCVN